MKIFLKNYMYNIRIKNVIVFACIGLLTSYIASAAVRTTSGTGNWSSVGTWGGASVPNSTDNVNVNHGLNLNSDLTILLSGIYNFNASNTGGTPNVTLGSWPISGGDLNINSPSYITLGTVSANNGTIHIYSGATLNITGSLAILGTQIIIDAGGTLIVGGNFTNTNGNITNNGDITVAASYTGYNTFLQTTDVTGTGSFTTGGSMTNDSGFLIPSSTIYGSTNDCNTGPCNAACLSGMTTGAISGPSTICSGATGIVFSTPAVSGGVNFTWTLPAGTVITGGAGTRTITVTAGATAGNVTVKASNISCSSSNTSTYAVRVGKPTGTAAIAGPTNSCQNVSGITYTVSGVSGASSYSWTVPLGATITSGTGTSSITVTMGTTSGIVQVVPSNICGNATGSTIGSVNVTLNPAPTAMISYSSNSYCKNTTTVQIPAFTGTTGGTFSSSPSGLNLNSSTGAITPSLSTNNKTYTITYTVTGSGCTTATATASVGIKNSSLNSPTAITGAISVCPNESGMPYSISAVIDAASYSWGLPSGTVATSGVGSRSIIATLGTVSGTISVAPIKSDGCMGNTTTLWVDVSTNCTLIWTGTSSSDWGTTSNWSPAIIPASGDYISIPNVTRKPIITTGKTGNIKNIIIEPSSSITLNNGGALNVYGNITNNGIVTADDGSTINMLGATAQTITGVPVLYNVVINNTAGVSIASPLAVNGALSLKAGVLTTNNKLTINFDNGGNIAYN
uniref:hypothetical protein n=1 Tax=uncultured Cytophaga sp. TaxID=160238 RepID=UPI00260CF657